ncbi:MAG TPA: hypothetical protein VK721_11730 [Solirubrobacteraceae bacterium]|nr:hypothetical protein [Solirubrobacteraceae bacterium]
MTPPAAAAAAAPATRGRSTAPVRPRVAPPRPRRISGPARPPAKRGSRAGSNAQVERGLVPGLLGALDGVSRSGALDRLIRGRIWIGVITFALIGIVTLQLLVLQLNASIGRSLVREAQLQRTNATLSIEGSELAGGERVETQAALLGMQLVPEGSLRFLTDNPRADIARAAAAVKARAHVVSSSGETGATTTAPSTDPSATAASAASEPSLTAETGTAAATPPTGATGESDPSSSTAGAPTSEAVAPSTSSASAPTAASTSSEAPAGGAVAEAGGVGSAQPNGGG